MLSPDIGGTAGSPLCSGKEGSWTERKLPGECQPSLALQQCAQPCGTQHAALAPSQRTSAYPGSLGQQIRGLHSSRAEAEAFDVYFSPAGDSVEAYPSTGF